MKWAFVLTIVSFSCGNVEEETKSVKENKPFPIRFDKTGNFKFQDRTFSLRLTELTEPWYLANWGQNTKNQDTILLLPNGNAQGYYEENVGIIINQGCGTACSFVTIFLPNTTKTLRFQNSLLIQMKDSLIVFRRQDSTLIIQNFISKKQQKLDPSFFPSLYSGFLLDSISIHSNDTLFIEGQNRDGDKVQNHVKLNLKIR